MCTGWESPVQHLALHAWATSLPSVFESVLSVPLPPVTDFNPGLGSRARMLVGYKVTLIIWLVSGLFAQDRVHCLPSVSGNRTGSAGAAALGVPQKKPSAVTDLAK